MDDTYNIAIIGQTGVGKSALVNYLFGKDAPSGTGKPVTAKGFHKYDGLLNPSGDQSVKVKIFDSWGLEVGKAEEWNEMFKEELENRGVESHPKDWFHSVIYCIGASSNRVQNADIKIIEEALANEYPVTIVLTKADGVSEEDEATLVKEIKDSLSGSKSIRIVPTCAVEKKKRNGYSTKTFGKEALEKAILNQALAAIAMRLPICLEERLNTRLSEWRHIWFETIQSETGFLNKADIESRLIADKKSIISNLNSEKEKIISEALRIYKNSLAVVFGTDPRDENIADFPFPIAQSMPFSFRLLSHAINASRPSKNRAYLIDKLLNIVIQLRKGIKEDRRNIDIMLKNIKAS